MARRDDLIEALDAIETGMCRIKESIDRELRRIMGDGFRPWEERYPPEVFK